MCLIFCIAWDARDGIADGLGVHGKSCRSTRQALECEGEEVSVHTDLSLSRGRGA